MKSRLVAGPVVVADEVRVDVEAGVGDDAEVLVLFAVEVEGVAVGARVPRVAARHAGVEVAHCRYISYKCGNNRANKKNRALKTLAITATEPHWKNKAGKFPALPSKPNPLAKKPNPVFFPQLCRVLKAQPFKNTLPTNFFFLMFHKQDVRIFRPLPEYGLTQHSLTNCNIIFLNH